MVESVVAEFIVTEEVYSKPVMASVARRTITSGKRNLYYFNYYSLKRELEEAQYERHYSGNGKVGHL